MPLDDIDSALQEFERASAEWQPPPPAPPTPAEQFAETTRRWQAVEDWKRAKDIEYEPLYEAQEAVDKIRDAVEMESWVAGTRQRLKLNGFTPDEIVAGLRGNEPALQALAKREANIHEEAHNSAFEQMTSLTAAMLSVRGVSHEPMEPDRPSGAQLSKMSDREWAEYKERRLVEDAPAHAAYMGYRR